ncbi:hypothetical protein BKA62DRAFT_590106, partial [Auriculariales sp. MPI-PUGE-AT-0066]
VPRSPNAFICFRRLILGKGYVPIELASDNPTLSKVCGRIWKSMDDMAKKRFHDIADHLAREHKKAYPDYKYQPKR